MSSEAVVNVSIRVFEQLIEMDEEEDVAVE